MNFPIQLEPMMACVHETLRALHNRPFRSLNIRQNSMKKTGVALMLSVCLSLEWVMAQTAGGHAAQRSAPVTFTNPVRVAEGADPWVVYRNGFYYYTATSGNEVRITKSKTLAGLASEQAVTVWRRPETGPNARDVWAPELHFLRGKWWVYYTATSQDGSDANRRVFALEAQTPDPQGAYSDRGQILVPGEDVYAIDGTVFEREDGALFFLWSGRPTNGPGPQNIYIAPLRDPATLSGPRVLLSTPTYDWEKHGWWVNEGPEVLRRGGKTFVVYSGSGYTTPDYALGLLTNESGNLLDPGAWTKSPVPVFHRYSGPDGQVFGPGHNGFFKSPDGSEDWIIYHARETGENTGPGRTARAQRFIWNPDGTPNFGFPVPANTRLAPPSGEFGTASDPTPVIGTGLRGEYFEYATPDKPAFETLRLTREGEKVDFYWNVNAPAPGLGKDRFAVRWRGQIQPRYSEIYTFQTYADDGVRVHVAGQRVLESWKSQVATAARGFIYLEAGQKYDLEVEYFEADGPARVGLYWQSFSQPFEPVPRSRLFPPPAAARP